MSAQAVEQLYAGLRAGDVRSLARAASLVEDGAPEAADLLRLCQDLLSSRDANHRALRVGVTGPAGAGKSTLVDALARELRARGRKVGIVAVDPSSPFSGGAILGDRIRLGEFAGDAGIFMRSMATRGHLGGLARATDDVLTVIEAAWPDGDAGTALLIETTGVGQGEIEVVRLADVVAVVLVPGMGDSVQSLKAGVLEIASVFVLNKADREGIERLEQEIQEMLGLTGIGLAPRVVRTVAPTGEGVVELLQALDAAAAGGGIYPRLAAPVILPRPQDTAASVTAFLTNPAMDHLGIAVRSLDEATKLYRALGIRVSDVEEVAQERVRVVMLQVGESRIELLEATGPESAIARFIAKRGEGIHHIALRVPDLPDAVARLVSEGVRLVSEKIQAGAGGHRYVFVHPASANGVLLELVEAHS